MVYGLQRAFKIAGAKTIVLSLWRVNDLSTEALMTTFYKNWQIKKMDKRAAFEAAQIELRKQYKDVYHWAHLLW